MTSPLPRTPGDDREDHAQAAGAAIAAIYAQIELAIVAAVAYWTRKAAAGALPPAVANRRLYQQTAAIFAAARDRIRVTLDEAISGTLDEVRGRVQADAGPAAALNVSLPDTAPITAPLDVATQTAIGSASDAFTDAATAAMNAPPPPVPPGLPPGGRLALPPGGDRLNPYDEAVRTGISSIRGGMPANSLSLSRIQAAQVALDQLADRGITGYVDKAGRHWNLVSYVEMATRTGVANLWDDLQAKAMIRSGYDLVKVYTHSTEGTCPACLPWLGRTLSLTGHTAGYPTLDEAKAAGFRHPNCRCAWFPLGAGVAEEVTGAVPMDQAATVYQASQRQRAYERRVRAAGRRAQAAMSPEARRRARREQAAARSASAAHREATGLRMTQAGWKRREHPFRAR
jgi:hypothetical protein